MTSLLKKLLLIAVALGMQLPSFCWGFYAHQKINYYAVFLLPPQMMLFYKKNIQFISEHAVDPDKRRYALSEEGPRHYIDIDFYGDYPFNALPRRWDSAAAKYGEDVLMQHGIVPWWLQIMQQRLTTAFKERSSTKILKLSAEIGHYLADAHVPLHASGNHNGQLTNQRGIHGFWESRLPELLAEKEWNFFIGKAQYIGNKGDFIWQRILESAAAADTVLKTEKELTLHFPPDQKYAFENRNGKVMRQYSTTFSKAFDKSLNGMVERRMRQSIFAVASFWYTAWVDAGQPDLNKLFQNPFTEEDLLEFQLLNNAWKEGAVKGREHE